MPPIRDTCDLLAGEVLGEMAGNFFGRRKALEDFILLVGDYARSLQALAAGVGERAGLLNFLLAGPPFSHAFYTAIGVRATSTLMGEDFSSRALPSQMPSALFGAGRFKKLVKWAYERLQNACDSYLYGPPDDCRSGADAPELPTPSYQLVMEMARRANEEVQKINREVSATGVLQTARKFVPSRPGRHSIEGVQPGMSGERLDRAMAFAPVDIASLSLIEFPPLPEIQQVSDRIAAFCRSHYAAHRQVLRSRMNQVARQIRRNRPVT